jgi:ABC-type lipoprotein release transport system permease subunit
MAWRNVWRNSRRSLVTMAAMGFALLVMILFAGLIEGYLQSMERNVLDLEVGDLQVFAEGYRDNPSIYERIEDIDILLARLDDAGFPSSARLLASGLTAAGDSSSGALLRGVDVRRDARVSLVHKQVADGEWLDSEDPHGVVIGRRLARTLSVGPGDELLVLTQGADGSMANELYVVRGVLKGISDETDRTGVFMTARAFRELMVLPKGVHQIIVRRPVGADLSEAALKVRSLASAQDVKTWRQLLPTLASLMDSQRGMMFAMFLIVYIAIGILILNTMLMAVFERIREFGVLKALGVGPGDVLRLIIAESAIQTGLATMAGLVLSIPGLWYLSRVGIDMGTLGGFSVNGIVWDPIWRAAVTAKTYTNPLVTLLLVVSVAVIYPALKAALLRPVDAMRYR